MKAINGGHLKPKVHNEGVFSEYNKDSCYWAGFIAADGCISGNSLYICLHAQDLDHLQKFMKYVGSTHKISVNTERYNRAQIAFVNRRIEEDLLYNFNITQRKTETYEMPCIPEEFIWDFIRGYFDGDGCICESFSNPNSKLATLYSTIVGSKFLIPELYNIINLPGSIQEKAKVKVIKYCSNSSKVFLDRLYNQDNITFLSRKYNNYQRILREGIKVR